MFAPWRERPGSDIYEKNKTKFYNLSSRPNKSNNLHFTTAKRRIYKEPPKPLPPSLPRKPCAQDVARCVLAAVAATNHAGYASE